MKGMKTKLAALILTFCPLTSFAWGGIGHRTVALIAEANLSEQAKSEIKKILGRQSLAEVANWADSLKSTGEYRQTTWYHFEKIPDNKGFVENLRALPEWQQKKGGIVGAILLANKILRESGSPREREDALKFLVHFAGDIHQPLHSGRPEDMGGVSLKVEWMGKPMSLHKVWDSGMIATGHRDLVSESYSESGSSENYARFLVNRYRQEPVELSMNVEGWLNESMAQRSSAYNSDYQSAQEKYQARHLPVIDQRIYMAGVRLAAMLNEIFAKQPVPGTESDLWARMEKVLGDLHEIITFRP